MEGHNLESLERLADLVLSGTGHGAARRVAAAAPVAAGARAVREILGDLDRWHRAGERAAVARVVDLEGSGPRSPGAAMAVTANGEVVGSVSGGCVEGAVVTESLEVIETGDPRIVTFGYSDDEAFAVGLTCGGTIHLFLEPLEWGPVHTALSTDLSREAPAALATVVEGPGTGAKMLVRPVGSSAAGSLGGVGLDRAVERDARGELAAGRSGIRRYSEQGEIRGQEVSVFVESFAPPPRMVIFGAVDFTAALARGGESPGIPGHRLRRQGGVCHSPEVPDGRRGGRVVA